MDFHRLVAKLNEIGSRPSNQQNSNSTFVTESPGGSPGPAQTATPQTATPQTGPTMNLTLNARTMTDIESMMRLIQKVNPDVPQTTSATPLTAEPSIAKVGADFEIDGLDATDSHSMDMDALSNIRNIDDMDLDDLDINDIDDVDLANMNSIDDELYADDEDDTDDSYDYANAVDDELNDIETDEDGGFRSATTKPNEKYKSIDYMTNRLAGGMNGPKKTFPKVAGGDNPMQRMEESDEAFKESIRNDLRRRLEEAKKPSDGMSKSKKSSLVKKAKAGIDIGKPGKSFDKVAKASGGGEKGKKIAAAAMWKQQAKK